MNGEQHEDLTNGSGPLRVSEENPRYFVDGRGRVVYLTGSHTWANFQDNGHGNPPPVFDYAAYLDFLAANNHNFFRLWTWEQARWTLETADDAYWFNPEGPYVRSDGGQGNALDGKAKWDLSRFNQEYFDRMRARIEAAGARGIYVSIMLFDGWSVVSNQAPALNNPWRGHPYNRANNINGIDGDVNGDNNGREVHTLANGAVTALQEAYVKKVIDTVNDLDNVLYEIANEAPDDSLGWQAHLVGMIHRYEAGKPKLHPVGVTGRYEWKTNDLIATGAEWISPGKEYMVDPPPGDGRAVVIVDTDHLWGIGGDYVWVWKTFTRGLHPIFMDGYDGAAYGVGGQGFDFHKPQWVKLRANMGYTRAYAQRVQLGAMLPRGDLCSTRYCLGHVSANGDAEFIVYQPKGGNEFTVDLTGVSGSMGVEWLNPDTGSTLRGAAVSGGGIVRFAPPFDNPNGAVLLLQQTPSVLPTNTPSATPNSTATPVPTSTPTLGPSAPFPATSVLESFNRTNSAKIGSNWTGSTSGYRIVSSSLDVGTTSDIYWRPKRYVANQEAFVTLSNIDPNGSELGLILKAQSYTGLGPGLIEVFYSPQSQTVQVWTYTTATRWRQVGSSVSATFVDGDQFGARTYADGRVEAFRNGQRIGHWNITPWPYSASTGFIGIFTLHAPNAMLDDFGGGASTAGVPDGEAGPPPQSDGASEESAMLRYKGNVWLPEVLAPQQ
jgi:hypothetical protein